MNRSFCDSCEQIIQPNELFTTNSLRALGTLPILNDTYMLEVYLSVKARPPVNAGDLKDGTAMKAQKGAPALDFCRVCAVNYMFQAIDQLNKPVVMLGEHHEEPDPWEYLDSEGD